MKDINIEIPEEYPTILLACCVLSLELVLATYFLIVPARLTHFGEGFMKKFEDLHEETYGEGEKIK